MTQRERGRNIGGAEQADKPETETEIMLEEEMTEVLVAITKKEQQARLERIVKRKKRLRIGSWNVCRFAEEGRKRIEIAGRVSKRDLDMVGSQDTREKEAGEDRMQSWRVRMGREGEEGTE